MAKISIVVPVYKVERYLKRCIDSILAQTVIDYELILVDDGSPDNSGKMCDDYAERDSRIHVIHQENGGLSAARNTGIEWSLKNSNSDWITFVDSDDWIHPQYLDALLTCATKYNCLIVIAKMLITEHEIEHSSINDDVYSIMRTEDAFKDQKLGATAAWGRLYRKELFREIRFPVGKLHEDRYTTYKLYFRFKTVGVVNVPLYYYFVNPEGIVHSPWTPRKMDNLEAAEQQMEFFHKTGNKEMYLFIVEDYIKLCINAIKKIGGKKQYQRYVKIIRNKLRWILFKERKILSYNIDDQFNIYKYAYPIIMKIYRRFKRIKIQIIKNNQ